MQTERLLIRDWCIQDIEPYFDLVSNNKVMKFIGSGLPQSKEDAQKFVLKSIEEDEDKSVYNRKAVALANSNELIGCCGLKMCDWGLDFGWKYRFQYWGKGYATEAASCMYRDFLSGGIHNFVSVVHLDNIASQKIIEKMGMVQMESIIIGGKKAIKYKPKIEQCASLEFGSASLHQIRSV